jgi:hypothetical protein
VIEYQVHYNTARPHQGIAQRVPGCERESPASPQSISMSSESRPKPVLNGLINEYSRAA